MHATIVRVWLTLSLALLGATAAPAPASAVAFADEFQSAVQASLISTASPAPCSDRAYNLMGGKWTKTLKWSFNASSTPAGLAKSATRDVIKRAFSNIVNARNDCGRPDRVSATASYLGTTSLKASVTKRGRCAAGDGKNVVGFGPLPAGTLAVTCTRFVGNRIVESDIRINSNVRWALSMAGCVGRPLLEPVMTHEVGHAYGLDHVSEGKHGRLTMSTFLDGPCQNGESTLGLGDLRGLQALY